MMISLLRPLAAACVLLACVAVAPILPAVHAADAPAEVLDATDSSALRPHVGQEVTVKGTITTSGHSKAGNVAYLNFAGAHKGVALVFFLKSASGKASSEDDLKNFVGKLVTVSGKLEDYKGDLQIKIESLDDLKVTP